jgi:hypothetical protein
MRSAVLRSGDFLSATVERSGPRMGSPASRIADLLDVTVVSRVATPAPADAPHHLGQAHSFVSYVGGAPLRNLRGSRAQYRAQMGSDVRASQARHAGSRWQ